MPERPFILPDDAHNRTLMGSVHPVDWKNPVPVGRYNLVVVGGGTAGLVTAAGAAGLGAKVALIERHLMGGDCLNAGCVPSKALIRSARAAYDARSGEAFGIPGQCAGAADFRAVMERMRRVRAGMSSHDSFQRFSSELGIDVFLGSGTFIGPGTLRVGDVELYFAKAAVCTGARAKVPDIPGLAEAGCLTNETVFWLTELPKRLLVIGGGPIGCELSQAFARLGSVVTVIETGDRLLPREDADASAIVHRLLTDDGVKVVLQCRIIKAEKRGGDKVLAVQHQGRSVEMAADEILAGVGRAPNVEGLGLEAAGVRFDLGTGIQVDDTLRTANPDIYAAGDVCSAFKFTHAADAQARILIANALFKGRQKTSSLVIPWCTYTDPEVAHVGMYEREARSRGIDVLTLTVPLADVDRAVIDNETNGFARVHLKKGSDRILGATIVARHAGEMINEITLAMTAGLGLSAIGKTVHPYPTQGEAVRKLADRYNRTRLTPFVKRVLSAWLRWMR